MKLSNVLNVPKCIPIEYQEEFTDTGSKIGGIPPRNAVPLFRGIEQRYFCTIELEENWAVSIYYSFDIYGDDDERDIISYNNQPLYPSKLIHAVIHQKDRVVTDLKIVSDVTCHRIKFGKLQSDLLEGEFDIVLPNSKIGGAPFADNTALVGNAFAELLRNGYRQLIQFDTPNPSLQPYIDAFPWDPGWLHVFVRNNTIEDFEFAFVVQQ